MLSKEEIKLTNEVIEIMEWEERELSEIGIDVLFNDFFPIMINKKYVLEPSREEEFRKLDNTLLFRPLKNQKHVQFLIDYLFDNNPELKELLITTKKEPNKKYNGRLIDQDGETVVELTDYITEVELKFSIFYYYYNEKEVKQTLKAIKKFDIEHKSVEPSINKKKTKRTTRK